MEHMARNKGSVLVMTLVFVTAFLVIFTGLIGMVSRSYHEVVLQSQDEQAFQIAEAGLNFGRWRLVHASGDFSSQTRSVADPLGGNLGQYDISFTPLAGSTTVEIQSIGRTVNQPNRPVTLRARYGIPSIAKYAFITNQDVWYQGNVSGLVHANGGVRMDGQADSLVTSAKTTYVCQPSQGCNPSAVKPGVWGAGGPTTLWEYPVAAVDYAGLTSDLLVMKNLAQVNNTYYGQSGALGYHVVFNDNNTYSLYRVTAKGPAIYSWAEGENNYKYVSLDIGTEAFIGNYPVSAGAVLFFEDHLWVQGDIRTQLTVAAGKFPDTPSNNVDIIINGDISYGGVKDGSRIFGMIAQRNVLIPWSAADNNLEINGAFIAQKGYFGRRFYPNCCGAEDHRLKAQLNLYGMIASNGVPVTAYMGGGGVASGYQGGQMAYDTNLLYRPPPHFPTTGQYQFISWEEQQ